MLPRRLVWSLSPSLVSACDGTDGDAADAARRRARSRHGRDGDAARARRAHAHDFDERLRIRLAGRHHRVRGRRLPRRRRVRRRRRSRAERAAARRTVDGVARSRSRDEASGAQAARSRAHERSGSARSRPVVGHDEFAVEGGSRSAALRAAGVRIAARVCARRSRDLADSPQVHATWWRPTMASSPRER